MSQLDSESTTIGDHKFEIFKLSPLEAQDTLIDIVQALAPAAGEIAGAIEGGVNNLLDSDLASPRVGAAVSKLVAGLTKDRMRALVATMRGVTHCDGQPLERSFEVVFRGDLPLMYRWLWFAIKVQFGNFSGLVQNALSQAARVGEQAAKSPSISVVNGR